MLVTAISQFLCEQVHFEKMILPNPKHPTLNQSSRVPLALARQDFCYYDRAIGYTNIREKPLGVWTVGPGKSWWSGFDCE